jgi:hypothetical protein
MPQRNRHQTADQDSVCQINLSAVTPHLRGRGQLSRVALAKITGLSKTTISSPIRELIERGFVREMGLESAGTGCPAAMQAFNPASGGIIRGEIENLLPSKRSLMRCARRSIHSPY